MDTSTDRPMCRCKAAVYKRDTYRYCGGRPRFKLYYTRTQCSREARASGFCAQHERVPHQELWERSSWRQAEAG